MQPHGDWPPGVKPVPDRNPWRWVVGAALALLLVLASIYLPLPNFYAYLPGPVREVETLVDVVGAKTYSSEGGLLLTTVSVDTEVTIWEMIFAGFDPTRTIVSRDSVTGGAPLDDLRRRQQAEMRASKQAAREIVLTTLGFGAPRSDGVRVEDTIRGMPAHGVLRPNDVIRSINGKRVRSTCDVGRAVGSTKPGAEVRLSVQRGAGRRTFVLEAASNPNDPSAAFVGVAMQDVNYRFNGGVQVDFRTGRIAGPSAGLMFALALYDRLTPEDLTRGRSIAGTGTISCDGRVGSIGGIEQKVAGAEQEGADVFLAPASNAEAARRVAGGIEIVAVSSFDEAIGYLTGSR